MVFKTPGKVQETDYTPVECVGDNLQLVVNSKGKVAVIVTPEVGEKRYAFGKTNSETRAYFRKLKRRIVRMEARL